MPAADAAGNFVVRVVFLSGTQLPEDDRSGSGHIERIHAVVHRNPGGVITVGNGFLTQAVSLRAQHNGQLFRIGQDRVFNGDGVVRQRHGCGGKAQRAQGGDSGLWPLKGIPMQPGPGDLKDGAHAHPHRAAVEGVTAGGRNQDSVHPQSGGRAKDSADVGGVGNVLQYHQPSGTAADLLRAGKGRTAHGA